MKKIALSFISIVSLLSPVVFIFRAPAQACGGPPPSSLLSLYQDSDAIYVARFSGQQEGEAKEGDDSFVTELRKNFDVSTTLKGESVKIVTLFDERYVYKPEPPEVPEITEVETVSAEPESVETEEDAGSSEAESSEEIAIAGEADTDAANELEPGDDVLLFLRKDKETSRMQLTDYYYGLKDLPREDIAVYEARIKELAPIFAAKKPDAEKITDWLVTCAADPVTRWEGTYELQRSFNNLEYARSRAIEESTENVDGPTEFVRSYYRSNHQYAEAMNEFHRQTLTNILLTAEFRGIGEKNKKELVNGDRELMWLVSQWANSRVAMLFLNQLRSEVYSATDNAELMESVSAILKDAELKRLAEKFRNVSYRSDDDEVNANDLDEVKDASGEKDEGSAAEVVDSNGVEIEPAVQEPAISDEKEDESDKPSKAKPRPMNYKQFRGVMAAKFIARADRVILNPEAAVGSSTK